MKKLRFWQLFLIAIATEIAWGFVVVSVPNGLIRGLAIFAGLPLLYAVLYLAKKLG